MRACYVAVAVATALAACGGTQANNQPEEPYVQVEGSCDDAVPIAYSEEGRWRRPVGDLSRYATPLVTDGGTLDFVRVRANPVWPAEDLSNVIGTIPSGTRVLVWGPMKNLEYSAGIGYAVAVVDSHGRRCRGYLARTVVLREVDGRMVRP